LRGSTCDLWTVCDDGLYDYTGERKRRKKTKKHILHICYNLEKCRNFIIYTHHQISLGRSSQGNRWVGHVAHMGKERKVYKVLVGKPEETDHLKDQGVDGRMGSEWFLGRLAGGGGVDWNRLAQDRDPWRAVVNVVMNLRVLAPQS
jgi:hypothetical protein